MTLYTQDVADLHAKFPTETYSLGMLGETGTDVMLEDFEKIVITAANKS